MISTVISSIIGCTVGAFLGNLLFYKFGSKF